MRKKLFFCFFLILVGATSRINGQASDNAYCGDVGKVDTLQMTVALFRHGDRTPISTYPNDPYQIDTWEKWGGWGYLTQIGMEQHYFFGRWVRKCYGPVINETYLPKEFYARSTDIDRTLESGLAHIAGLFAPKGYQVWSKTEEIAKYWQPIPVHTTYLPDEYLLTPDGICPPYQQMIEDTWKNDLRLKQIQRENQEMLNFIAKNAGYKQPGDLHEIANGMPDTLFIEKLKGLQLPDWINSTVYDKIYSWNNLWLDVHVANDEILKLGMGDLVNNLQQLFRNKTKNTITYKHVIYSAHDSTLGCLLRVYDPNWNGSVPPYASSVLTELHKDSVTNRYFIKVFYRNNNQSVPLPITVRNCSQDGICWLDDFLKALQPFSLNNKKTICFPRPKPGDEGLSKDAIIAICVCVTFAGTLLLSILLFLVVLKRCKRTFA